MSCWCGVTDGSPHQGGVRGHFAETWEEAGRGITAEQRSKVDAVKAAYAAATDPIGRIVACNMLGPGDIALAVLALHEIDHPEEGAMTDHQTKTHLIEGFRKMTKPKKLDHLRKGHGLGDQIKGDEIDRTLEAVHREVHIFEAQEGRDGV